MKKTYSIILLVVIIMGAGCKKFLVHDHPTSVSDETWWNTEKDAFNALNSVYVGVPDGASGRQLMFLSALSDEAVARQSTRGDYESYVKGVHNATWNVSAGVWEDDYKDIRRACRFLENVDRCFFTNPNLQSQYKYEARALRAYYHMELLMFFGGIPIVTESVTPADSYLARSTETEVFDFIVSELTECGNNLPTEYDSNNDLKRFTAGTCWALISRLALYYKRFELARDAAKKVIDLGVFQLYKSNNPQNSYYDLFRYAGELNKERIFFRENTSGQQWLTFAPQGVAGKTVISPTASAVNNYETKQGKTIQELGPDSFAIYQQEPDYKNNRDPRLAASVLLPGQTYTTYVLNPFDAASGNLDRIGAQNATATGFWVNKYLDPKDRSGTRTLDYMIIRYAEILLTYVEALIELGQWDDPDVTKYLNEIRARATMPAVDVSVYNNQEKLRELVRRERQAELAFEGVRYFDIRRWGILGTVMNGQVYGAIDPVTNEPVKVEMRSCNVDRDYRWPIPQAEILANPNMEQNDLY